MNTNTPLNSSLTDQEIAARAYDLWEMSGRQHGCDLEHWLQAKTELSLACDGQASVPMTAAKKSGKSEKQDAADSNFQRNTTKPGKKGMPRPGREPLFA
ncbi:MAG: DUF2934 domain-containing protein [Verrucomicrobiota bacterium]